MLNIAIICLLISVPVFAAAATAALAYLKTHVQIPSIVLYILPMAVARSSSDGNTICYVLRVLLMTSCFYTTDQIGQNDRQRVCFIQFARWRHRGEVCRLTLHIVQLARSAQWQNINSLSLFIIVTSHILWWGITLLGEFSLRVTCLTTQEAASLKSATTTSRRRTPQITKSCSFSLRRLSRPASSSPTALASSTPTPCWYCSSGAL